MPLLKKKMFKRAPLPEDLRDDEEVFYCAITNEIFRDYEEFSERMFLCNSMVWTCSLTGKANLTFAEALESEENARKSLEQFPAELKTPILYLASRTKRTAFGEMAEDVFSYARDRFFIGENVETSFTGAKWKDSHVLQVIAPSASQIKSPPKNGNVESRHHPPASLYKYEIEHLDADDEDISEIMIVDCNQIRRKKEQFSREKCKLFLKQHVEQDSRGIFVIKPSAVESFKIDKIKFEQIFGGLPPVFNSSKKVEKTFNGKKTRQESLHKFLTKNGGNGLKTGNNNSIILEKMKKREEEFKLKKQQKKEEELALKQKQKEEDLALKQKQKEENTKLAIQVRDWYKPKEDLELIDHKKLPAPSPVKLKIPDKYVGDMLMVLEFVHSFSKLLSTKDFFPGGLTLELMERALMKNEVAGPFIDLIQMLLTALFNCQDEEASQYKAQLENPSSIKSEDNSYNNMNYREATRLATVASSWSTKYQGLPLGRLPLYSLTTSEILRLHLLSSGAVITYTGARWRYQQRGGYTSEDDPGLYLRLHSPHILKALEVRNVVELPIADKLQILSCLINQLLTYADVRDVVEERMEKVKQAKSDYKATLAMERKREQEFLAARIKLKKDKENPKLEAELKKLEVDAEMKKGENEWKLEELKKALRSCDKQVVMGHDRAMRQYLKMECVPGFLVNFEDDNRGTCLSSVVKQNPDLVNASRDATLAHLKKKLNDGNSSSDKENSPSKSPKKHNGINNSLHQQSDSCDELMLCSANPATCVVHSSRKEGQNWYFYKDAEKVTELIDSLNERGVRERELLQNLKNNQDGIEKLIQDTPVACLNPELASNSEGEQTAREKRSKKSNKAKYEDANLGYPSDADPEEVLHNVLIDNILEMEEKIFAGNLGRLAIKDRNKWRDCLQNKNYKDLDKTLVKRDENTSHESSDNVAEPNVLINNNGELQDLNADPLLDSLSEIKSEGSNREEFREAVSSLAIALIQVGQGVDPKYLKKPLGRMSTQRHDKNKKENMLNMWERSLMVSTSFSQVFLHYSTLDSCVTWAKSVLLARCKICRRTNDSENMLLCDSCNWGHHLYCLKPKLKAVPPGDWFCDRCLREKKIENPLVLESPPKKRPIFKDEEDLEDEAVSNEENGDVEDGEDDEEEGDGDEDDEIVPLKVEVCRSCGSGGELICCEKCSSHYHIECVEPPLRRPPRGGWSCTSCKKPEGRKRRYDKNYFNGAVVQHTGVMNGQRRCAAKALYKIHDFAKSLRQLSESDDSSEEEEEVSFRRYTRRDEGRVDLPLHNAALHEVLSEIMKDYNAWPFLRPVQKTEVPDYYDVITKPMDFGTIKYKLNMGEYYEDAQFMADALLVFQNCNTYNHTEDDVYKCGVELLKHFQKKCKDLGLKLPEELDCEDDIEQPKKKIRTK